MELNNKHYVCGKINLTHDSNFFQNVKSNIKLKGNTVFKPADNIHLEK